MVESGRLRPLATGARSLTELLHDDHLLDRLGELPGTQRGGRSPGFGPAPGPDRCPGGLGCGGNLRAKQGGAAGGVGAGGLVLRPGLPRPRPELFFKATPSRVVGPGAPIRVRRDTLWCVPEPELALVLSPSLRLVGFTIGNDVSARDIEGENPLYLPQAKVYDASCALGPVVTLAPAMPPLHTLTIRLEIERNGTSAFDGSTSFGRMVRRLDELIDWLGRDNLFPDGVVLADGYRHRAPRRIHTPGGRPRPDHHRWDRHSDQPGRSGPSGRLTTPGRSAKTDAGRHAERRGETAGGSGHGIKSDVDEREGESLTWGPLPSWVRPWGHRPRGRG